MNLSEEIDYRYCPKCGKKELVRSETDDFAETVETAEELVADTYETVELVADTYVLYAFRCLACSFVFRVE
ncbi:MAG: hypothetical protein GY749_40300 [Desulfobacteraceae bacterium]|nr:hypothetical protein [Desulfobacteraceae bacterium]